MPSHGDMTSEKLRQEGDMYEDSRREVEMIREQMILEKVRRNMAVKEREMRERLEREMRGRLADVTRGSYRNEQELSSIRDSFQVWNITVH